MKIIKKLKPKKIASKIPEPTFTEEDKKVYMEEFLIEWRKFN